MTKSRTCRRRLRGSLLGLFLFWFAVVVRARRPPNNPPPSPSPPDFFFSLSVDLLSDAEQDSDDELLFCSRFCPAAASDNPNTRSAHDSIGGKGNLLSPTAEAGSRSASSAGKSDGELFLNGSRGYGECYISAQALMCQGGGRIEDRDNEEDDEDFNDDEDDDNDNNDDGHSSMLSNLSLQRSRCSSHLVRSSSEGSGIVASAGNGYYPRERGGCELSAGKAVQNSSTRSALSATIPTRKTTKTNWRALGKTLSLRGGADAAQVGISGLLQSQAARNLLVTALVTLLFEGSIGHILEFLKIVKQTALTNISYLQVLRGITESKGVAGLWDGFLPWGVVQAVFKGAVFGLAYQAALDANRHLARCGIVLPPAIALTLAGGLGGAAQGYVLSPTLLLKTRVMTNPVFREKMSAWRTTWLSFQIGYDICVTEGLFALMKGSNVFALKRVFDWSSRYLFSDMFETLFSLLKEGGGDESAPLTVAERSAASMLGGVLSTCVTLPLDVLVAKTQDAKKAGVRVSALKLFRDELSDRGWSGLQKAYMQGFEARLLHVCLTTVVIKTLTPIAYRLLFPLQS